MPGAQPPESPFQGYSGSGYGARQLLLAAAPYLLLAAAAEILLAAGASRRATKYICAGTLDMTILWRQRRRT